MAIFGSDSDSKLEIVPDNEEKLIANLVASTLRDLNFYDSAPRCLRAVHPKHHGCVEARFTVLDLPEELRVGVFKVPGKTFPAAIRFSTGAPRVGADSPDQTLGMAIKLYGVEGERLDGEEEEGTQDFLMLNIPVFIFGDVADFEANSRKAFFPSDRRPAAPGSRAARSQQILGRAMGLAAPFQPAPQCPLDNSYFSTVPYQFGKGRVMKFRARPLRPVAGGPPATGRKPSYLGDALRQRMTAAREDIMFDLEVQVRDSKGLDLRSQIEDACTLWDETAHPFRPVARIAIPPQNIALADQFCEDLFFSPWHGLKAHRPLGGINRARRRIYRESAKRRGCPVSPRLPTAPPRR